jgi:hypothetical protein
LLGSLDQELGEQGDLLATLVPLLGSLATDRSEQRAQLATPGDKLGEPSTQLGEPSTQLGEPSTQLGEPSTQLGEPSTQLGEPSTERRSLSRLSAMRPSL